MRFAVLVGLLLLSPLVLPTQLEAVLPYFLLRNALLRNALLHAVL
jgi:hypothetical protein